MASSKVMPSTSNSMTPDLTPLSSHHHRHHHHLHPQMISDYTPNSDTHRFPNDLSSPMTVDGIENTLLDAEISLIDAAGAISAIDGGSEPSIRRQNSVHGTKTVDDVWREIVAGKNECKAEANDEMMTLEDFLAKAGAGEDQEEAEDIKVTVSGPLPTMRLCSGGMFGFDPMVQSGYQGLGDGVVIGVGNGSSAVGGGEVVAGRGKRRSGSIIEPLDKASQQRQRRMIKNRESAARSRERKQAYQVELESLAIKLEEENEQLLREKVERTKERYKQLMEKVVPVVEMRRPPRKLRRVRSMQW